MEEEQDHTDQKKKRKKKGLDLDGTGSEGSLIDKDMEPDAHINPFAKDKDPKDDIDSDDTLTSIGRHSGESET